MAVEFEFDFTLTQRQRTAMYVGFFLLGLIALCSIRNQAIWLKIIRPPIVLVGAIAGGKLLWDYRTPEKLETEWQTLEQQKQQQLLSEREQLEQWAEQQKLATAESVEVQKRLQLWADEQAQSYQQQWQQQQTNYENAIAQLQGKVAELSAVETFTAKHGYAGWIGNQAIATLLEYEVVADARDCHQLPSGEMYFWVEPRQAVKVKEVKALSEELQLRLGLLEPADISLEDGMVQILVKPCEQRLTKEKKEDAIAPPDKWFRESVRISNHYFIPGDTGSGKSELVNNIACVALQELGPETEIVIIDPKFPETSWIINGREVLPQYKGYSQIDLAGRTYPSAYDGIFAMAEDRYDRLSSATTAKLTGQPMPARKPRLYIVDEVPDLIANAGDAKQQVVSAILSVLRVGRSSLVRVLVLGQDPGCLAYGLKTTATLKNFTCYYLREFALKGIDDIVPTAIEKSRLKKHVAKQLKAAESDPKQQYFALVKYPGRAAFIAKLPDPKAYSYAGEQISQSKPDVSYRTLEDLVDDALVEDFSLERSADSVPNQPTNQPICPNCNSLSISKNGTRKGFQRFLCGDCGKSFQ